MTREEAIEVIKLAMAQVEWDYPMDYAAAFDMAIKALEQEPTTKNDLGVDWESYKDANGNSLDYLILNVLQNSFDCGDAYGYTIADKIIGLLSSVTPQEPRWIPVSERVAEFPCLACDIFEQIFIPIGIVVLNSRCYEGKDFAFNVEKFLKGKEVTLFGGEKVYEPPREIVAWMPLPEPYKAESEG